MNRLVTRGMGGQPGVAGRAGLITQGMGGIFAAVVDGARAIVRLGRSGTKRALQELEEVMVFAKLIRVNDDRPQSNVQGFIRVKVDTARHIAVNLVEGLRTRARAAWEDIKITVKRVK